ncbi:MAG TPA: (2Fe-2S)-binding protein [Flavobacteriaceae bacterium]|nr:(2Fe-2S)-binding protein [Flavobacteriaceae bacterium]MCB9213456.1 (2Fe-2S)-binding protein [Alteromonas sp.]HPF12241.1 (2Fe-2S)-binding protein [Flavobacteriaceae bacterium]HQU22474.1 (2Fe-2S)-binding protein [Flavobacteriaceae bacterium]HQU65871.1 (2Fe-2S)-binding protein [Flavobacteriaceae bacterium]
MAIYTIQINYKEVTIDVPAEKPVLWVLRDDLGLLGTKYGCGIAQCGACTVHLNGNPVRSCALPIASIGKGTLLTIEGYASKKHPVFKAWEEINVPQCGYCQTGQIMSAIALLNRNKNPDDKAIDAAMNGNLCRCGTYYRIRKAIKRAAKLN